MYNFFRYMYFRARSRSTNVELNLMPTVCQQRKKYEVGGRGSGEGGGGGGCTDQRGDGVIFQVIHLLMNQNRPRPVASITPSTRWITESLRCSHHTGLDIGSANATVEGCAATDYEVDI